MTKREFWNKWMEHNDGPPIWRDTKWKRQFMRDLNKVIKTHTNPLLGGITRAIFELEQTFKKGKE